MVFKMCEGISCSSFSVKELDVIVHKRYFHCMTLSNVGHSRYPTSLANLVVEVGTRHSHQILLCIMQISIYIYFKWIVMLRIWMQFVLKWNPGSGLKFGRCWVGSIAAEAPAKFQSNWKTTDLASSKLQLKPPILFTTSTSIVKSF